MSARPLLQSTFRLIRNGVLLLPVLFAPALGLDLSAQEAPACTGPYCLQRPNRFNNPPAAPAPAPAPAPAQRFEEEEEEPDFELPEWLDGFRIGGLIRIRPEGFSNYNFDRSDRVLLNSFTSICSVARTTNRSCSQSGGTEYPDFGKSNHTSVPLYISEEDTTESTEQKIQLGIHKEFGADVVAHIVLQDARVWGGQEGSINGINTANSKTDESTDVREANIEIFDFVGPVTFQIGRQAFHYGDSRLFGTLDWTGSGRSFDGIRFKYEGEEFSSFLGAFVLAEDSDDFNPITSGNESTTSLEDAYYAHWYNVWKPSEHFQGELYYAGVYKKWTLRSDPLVSFVNERPEVLTDEFGIGIASHDRATQRDNLHTAGFRLTNRTKKGRSTTIFDWTVEAAKQGGPTGERKTPENLDILLGDDEHKVRDLDGNLIYELKTDPEGGYYLSQYYWHQLITKKVEYDGYAGSIKLGIKPVKWLRIGAEYAEASGDKNPNDLKNSTFDHLFPTNHGHYGFADLAGWRNMRAGSASLTFDFGKGGKLMLAGWDVDKHTLEDSWYIANGAVNDVASTEAPTDYAGSAGNTESKEKQIYKKYLKREIWKQLYLRKDLFEEFDLVYKVKYKGINWNLGYSIVQAGDAVRTPKDDYGYLLATKYLDEVLFFESTHRTSAKIFNSGDFKNDWTPPTFDPSAQFAYVMMTLKF